MNDKRIQDKDDRIMDRLAIIGIDGLSYRLSDSFIAADVMPNMAKLKKKFGMLRTSAPMPEVSPVSWTTMMTGLNPGEHGVFGFTEIDPVHYTYRFPHFPSLPVKTIWESLGQNRRAIVINLPHTYPVRPLNGILVSGFVAVDLRKAVYPESILPRLKKLNYRFDPDFDLIPERKKEFFKDSQEITEIRYRFLKENLEKKWNLLIYVITETDRINHFFYRSAENRDSMYRDEFLSFYRRVDRQIGRITAYLEKRGIPFVLVSDHGFAPIKKEIYISQYLKEWGYLVLSPVPDKATPPVDLTHMEKGTVAFCLDPNRIYIHTRDRYRKGTVSGEDYESLRDAIKERFLKITIDGRPVIAAVHKKENVYSGAHIQGAPDLILQPHEGFDLKSGVRKDTLAGVTHFEGMHIRNDAFLIDAAGLGMTGSPDIVDVGRNLGNLINTGTSLSPQ